MTINSSSSTQTVEEIKAAYAATIEDFECFLASFAHFMGFARTSIEMKVFEAYLFCLRQKMPRGTCLPAVSVALSVLIGNAQGMDHQLTKISDPETKRSLLSEMIANRAEGLRNAAEWLSNESKTWSDPITNAYAEQLLSGLFETYYCKVSVSEVTTFLSS